MSLALKISDVAMMDTAAPSLAVTGRAVPYGQRWLELADAERRSGIPLRTLQRRCAVEWLRHGKARLATTIGQKRCWQVREDADAALMPAKFPEQRRFDASMLTAEQRQVVDRRKLYLDEWWAARKQAAAKGLTEAIATSRYVAALSHREGVQLSRRTLFGWECKYRADGLAGLVDGRRNNSRRGAAMDDPFLMEVQRLYLKPKRLTMKACFDIACELFEGSGKPTHSYKTCQRFLNKLPDAARTRWREGDSAFVAKNEPYIERDYAGLASNEIWCGDHHRLDLVVSDRGKLLRPWLTAWQDMRSRKIVGWQLFADDPNTDTIIAAFHDGVTTHGLPLKVIVDNGKDYDSYALQGRTKKQRRAGVEFDATHAGGLFARFDIKASFCWPYHGQSKPIERWFGTLADAVKVFDTWCGNSTSTRPEDFYRTLKAANAPTPAEFREWLGKWIDGYNNRLHTGQAMEGKSPAVVFNENLRERRDPAPGMLDTLAMKHTKPVKVTRNGVRFNKLNYGWDRPELHKLQGQQVTLLIDPKRIESVIVTALNGKFVCRANANQKVPFNATAADLKAAIATKKQQRKALREYHTHRPRIVDDLPSLMLDNMRREAQTAEPAVATSTIVRTVLDADSTALREAFKPSMRLAVGAEVTSGPTLVEWYHSKAFDDESEESELRQERERESRELEESRKLLQEAFR